MRSFYQGLEESDLEYARRLQDEAQEKINKAVYELERIEKYTDGLVDLVNDLCNKLAGRDNLVYMNERLLLSDPLLNAAYWETIQKQTEELAKNGHKIHIIVAEEVDEPNKRNVDEVL